VAEALEQGLVIAPVLGGYGALGLDRDELSRLAGSAHRLVFDRSQAERLIPGVAGRAGIVKVLQGPAVAVFDAGSRSGVGVGTEAPVKGLGGLLPGDLWLGVTDEPAGPGELIDDLGNRAVLAVIVDGAAGPGPTVVDFGRRPPVVDRRGALAILDVERELGTLVGVGPGIIFSVLVVCTGNSCRSPMAAAMFGRLVPGLPVLVGSAGTAAPEGAAATRFAVETAAGLGLDISGHRARQLAPEACRTADLILVMEHHHRDWVLQHAPEAGGRVRLLAAYPDADGAEVPDPVGRSLEFYARTAEQMRPGLELAARDVRQRFAGTRLDGNPVQEE